MSRVRALIDGQWYSDLPPEDPRVQRLRQHPTTWRRWVTPHGGTTTDGQPAYPAEAGRYHLYVSYACPWAHRAILYRRLKGLEDTVTMSVLHPRMAGPGSWAFARADGERFATRDHLFGSRYLHEVYTRGEPTATTVVTVPMLWDRATGTIVNRESGDIMRMLDHAFDAYGDPNVRFRPEALESEIERMNVFVVPRICAGVYRVGFAPDQATYDRELGRLFAALDELEDHLRGRRWLVGDTLTESDWHLFSTLVRFDAAYYGALRCSFARLVDYPRLAEHTRRLYEYPGVAETVDLEAIRLHYFDEHREIRRSIVPPAPLTDFRDTHPPEAGAADAITGMDRGSTC